MRKKLESVTRFQKKKTTTTTTTVTSAKCETTARARDGSVYLHRHDV